MKKLHINFAERGSFFKLNPEDDNVCRLRFIDNGLGRFYYDCIYVDRHEVFDLPVEKDSEVYMVKDVPEKFTPQLEQVLCEVLMKNIFSRLNQWQIGIVRTWLERKQIEFDQVQSNMNDNRKMMEEMVGTQACIILSQMKFPADYKAKAKPEKVYVVSVGWPLIQEESKEHFVILEEQRAIDCANALSKERFDNEVVFVFEMYEGQSLTKEGLQIAHEIKGLRKSK